DVVLRVEPAVTRAVAIALVAPRADFRESWILLDLDPPALVLGEMPVQRVQLVDREQVDRMLDEFLAEEVPAFVKEQPTPCEAGFVFDRAAGDGPFHAFLLRFRVDGRRQELQKGLATVE